MFCSPWLPKQNIFSIQPVRGALLSRLCFSSNLNSLNFFLLFFWFALTFVCVELSHNFSSLFCYNLKGIRKKNTMDGIVPIHEAVKLLPGSTSNGEPTFPWKLHMVLEESERLGFACIISWQGDRTFRVHNRKRFELHFMRAYFKQTQYRSFQRQCKL
jgi:hypothetical protein